MKKSRRLLSLLLAAVMLLGMFAITSFAEGESASVTIKTSNDKAVAGEIITVTVNVSTNYYAPTMRWPVLFSSDFFELVEGSVGAADGLAGLGGSVTSVVNPANAFTSTYTSDEYSAVVLQWMGVDKETSAWIPFNVPSGMDCFTFRLKVKEDVAFDTSGAIVVPEDSTLFYKQMVTDVEGQITLDKIVQCDTINFSFTNATVSYMTPRLIPVDGTNTVIDEENGLIRGLDQNIVDNLDNYLYFSGSGELQVTPSADNRMGTGTKLEILLGGEVYKTYTVVLAGDVNGDAIIDVTDYVWLDLAETYEITLDGAMALAADLNGDGTVDVNDKIALDSYLIFAGTIDQVTGTYTAY